VRRFFYCRLVRSNMFSDLGKIWWNLCRIWGNVVVLLCVIVFRWPWPFLRASFSFSLFGNAIFANFSYQVSTMG
jgi:hypothetical protein